MSVARFEGCLNRIWQQRGDMSEVFERSRLQWESGGRRSVTTVQTAALISTLKKLPVKHPSLSLLRSNYLSRQMGVSGVTHSSRWVWLKRLIGLLVWLFSCDTLPSVKTPMRRQLDTLVPAAGFRDNISSDAGKASAAMKLLLLNISHEFLR